MFPKVLSLAVAVAAALFYYRSGGPGNVTTVKKDGLYTAEELAVRDGVRSELLYLSIMGRVFDVTEGKKHYGPGANYNIFVGRDASKSFITGEFDDASPGLDDILTLSPIDLIGLENWMGMFDKRYQYKGKLIGRFYDDDGAETEYLTEVKAKLDLAKEEQRRKEEQIKERPPCNVEWDATSGSRVWCSKKSGGVSRDWEGLPRLLYEPGSEGPHCVCVHPERRDLGADLKEYEGCDPAATSCSIKD